MGVYKYIRQAWKKPQSSLGELWQERLVQWRREPGTLRIEKPTRLDRARAVGYKAKQGVVLIRQRVLRGGHERPQIKGGRRSKRSGINLTLWKNYQQIAEERVQRKYPNLVVLNSYWVGEDGKNRWYEVVLVDPDHPVIKADHHLRWTGTPSNRDRVFKGKTTAGRRSRGLMR